MSSAYFVCWNFLWQNCSVGVNSEWVGSSESSKSPFHDLLDSIAFLRDLTDTDRLFFLFVSHRIHFCFYVDQFDYSPPVVHLVGDSQVASGAYGAIPRILVPQQRQLSHKDLIYFKREGGLIYFVKSEI